MPSKVEDVIDGLVAVFRAQAGLSAPGGTGVPVYDGPTPSSAADLDLVLVADDDTPDSDEDVAAAEQSWAALGKTARDENGTVTCAAISQTGDPDDMPARRRRAYELVGLCEAALAADPNLGGRVGPPGWAHITGTRLRTEQTEQGAVARVIFVVSYFVRL